MSGRVQGACRLTEDINDFRRNVREWLADNCPEEMRTPMKGEFDAPWGGRVAQFDSDAQKMWFDRMVERRWLAPDWPEEYGGAGLSAAAVQVLAEELRRIRARPPILSEGLWMIGPCHPAVRVRRAEAGASAQDRARPDPLVPGLFGTGRRIRPCESQDPCRGPRRSLAGQRPEGLDQLCA